MGGDGTMQDGFQCSINYIISYFRNNILATGKHDVDHNVTKTTCITINDVNQRLYAQISKKSICTS